MTEPRTPRDPWLGRRAAQAAELIRFAIADLRLAAWFLWITPLLAALSRAREAARCSSAASSVLPASTASRNFRTAVRTSERTDLLRWRRFSLVLTRLIWDLMLATRLPRSLSCHRYRDAPAAGMVRARRALDRPCYRTARPGFTHTRVNAPVTSPPGGGVLRCARMTAVGVAQREEDAWFEPWITRTTPGRGVRTSSTA